MSRIVTRRQAVALTATATVAGIAALITRGRRVTFWPVPGRDVPDTPALWSCEAATFRLRVGRSGELLVSVGSDRFYLDSFYSCPAESIAWLALARAPVGEDNAGTPRGWTVAEETTTSLTIRSGCSSYEFTRRVRIDCDCLRVSDTILNTGSSDVAVLVSRHIETKSPIQRLLLGGAPSRTDGSTGSGLAAARRLGIRALESGGVLHRPTVTHTAEHPTVLLTTASSQIGVALEDTISRLQASLVSHDLGASMHLEHLAIRAGEEITLQWTIHPMVETAVDTFINRLRDDWRVNFPLTGACTFFDVLGRADLLQDQAALTEFIDRGALQALLFTPWLDYDNFDWRRGRFMSRGAYHSLMHHARLACGAAAPRVKCLGCMQSNLVTPPEATARSLVEGALRASWTSGIHELTDDQMRVADRASLPFHDSLIVTENGRFAAEFYENGPTRIPMIAMAVYAAPGNTHSQFLREQATFLLDSVGLDGLYVDQFNLAFSTEPSQRFSYSGWDGRTVDVDQGTGGIARRYVDGALVGDVPRRELAEFVLSRGKTMVANTASATPSFQDARIVRFVEGWPGVQAVNTPLGTKPPLARFLAKAQLGSPVAFGYQPPLNFDNPPLVNEEAVMKCIVAFLRHGLLYFHADATTSGALGSLIGAMYPLTPTGVHEGWLEGPERIVTTVSGQYARCQSHRPTVRCFDPRGNEIRADTTLSKHGDEWQVALRITDWMHVAVIT